MIDYKELLKIFKENSNKEFDDFNNTIIKSSVPTIGCTVPFVRSLAKNKTVDDVMSLPIHEYVEVDMLKGITVSQSKLPFEEKSAYLTAFANTIENWAVCDVSAVKVSKSEQEKYFKYFCDLAISNSVFVCRYGVVNLLANFLDEEHILEIFEVFSKITLFGEYYVDMAVAWLIATAMAKCRDQTVEYMENRAKSVLNTFTYNRALQKMRDSRRISPEDKAWTYKMKI